MDEYQRYKSCVICGGLFPLEKNRKTCSKLCKAKLAEKTAREKDARRKKVIGIVKVVCAFCGNEFTKSSTRKKYCVDTDCKIKATMIRMEKD